MNLSQEQNFSNVFLLLPVSTRRRFVPFCTNEGLFSPFCCVFTATLFFLQGGQRMFLVGPKIVSLKILLHLLHVTNRHVGIFACLNFKIFDRIVPCP
ncbi:ORF1101 [White spot syndrome virus]|uniref:ORF1101 n=1 Tax=White spot syndrome virus TaxID=342409 RepID=A0A2D3I5N2_9VIRU|nr:ORF1101 [White spot syndrome virus]